MLGVVRYCLLPALVALAGPTAAADLGPRTRPGFVATCEDLGRLCAAEGCGGDQIAAERDCRTRCPSAVTMAVVPGLCARPGAVLRRGG